MKRRREAEQGSEIRHVIEELSVALKAKKPERKEVDDEACKDSAQVKLDAVQIPTKAFLSVCKLVIQILGKHCFHPSF